MEHSHARRAADCRSYVLHYAGALLILSSALSLITCGGAAENTNSRGTTALAPGGPAGAVNWLDPLGYQKPAALGVAMPDETSATKYWVDFSGGSDTTSCGASSASPCATIRGLANRNLSGLRGNSADNPAYIYIKGTGLFTLYNIGSTFAGTPGKEIVIKPWPAGSPGCTTECTFTGNGNNPTLGDGATIHDMILDGGPDMKLVFTSDQHDPSGPKYALIIDGYNITFYRTQVKGTNSSGSNLFSVCANSTPTNCHDLSFINNEFYSCNQASGYQCAAIYVGPCPCGGANNCSGRNIYIKNNIMRDLGGEALEINPRISDADNVQVTGNAFHNVGKQTCSGTWDCRPAITFDSCVSPAKVTNAQVNENIMWDIGGSCIWDKGGATSPPLIYNNTCYDFHKGTASGVCTQGVCGGGSATVRNNIIFAPNSTAPFDGSPFTASNNLCGSGQSCGTLKQTWSANTLSSTDPNSSNFMSFPINSEAIGTGLAIPSLTVDYGGNALSLSTWNIGAGVTPLVLPAPANLRVQ